MAIAHCVLEIETKAAIYICNITNQLQALLSTTGIQNGQMLVFSRHTTMALTVNEDEIRLLADLETWLKRLAPPTDSYLHNDLHLREKIPPDEPKNAHAHLMAMLLSYSEVIPVMDGHLGLGTYQSVLLVELDGPRRRTVGCQIMGE